MREQSYQDEFGEDGEGGRFAKLALASRMRRRKKLGGLALAKKLHESEEFEDEDDDDNEDTHLGRLLLLAAAKKASTAQDTLGDCRCSQIPRRRGYRRRG